MKTIRSSTTMGRLARGARRMAVAAVAAGSVSEAAAAQVLGAPAVGLGGPSPPSVPGGLVRGALPSELGSRLPATLGPGTPQIPAELGMALGGMEARARSLLALRPDAVEPGLGGEPVVRGEILTLEPAAAQLRRLQLAGFRILGRKRLDVLGMEVARLAVPRGMSAREAIARARTLEPQGVFELDAIYFVQSSGDRAAVIPARSATARPRGARVVLGMVDGGVDGGHPAFARARVVQKGFASGGPRPSRHGTAVAGIAVEAARLPGAAVELRVADVYGDAPAGGAASALVAALDWLAAGGARVINISLGGPDNALLRRAVEALARRGVVLVAAVGNDGPAAPVLYPASYRSVVAVTGVDARQVVLPEAGRATHVDFSAAGMATAASPDGGRSRVRGTSFAAPIVAGRIAALVVTTEAPGDAVEQLKRQARDLGPAGLDPIYGYGLVDVPANRVPSDRRWTPSRP